MEKVYPDNFYITIYEDLKQKNGESSLYSIMMFNPSTRRLMDGYRSTTKSEIKQKLDKQMSDIINLDEFEVTENEYGWIYERYVKWLEEDFYEYKGVSKDDEYDDHEMFTVEISFYEEVYGIFRELEK